ncbi:MAG: hypothetical protein ABW321_32395, partial [Polyangiales bacterium]
MTGRIGRRHWLAGAAGGYAAWLAGSAVGFGLRAGRVAAQSGNPAHLATRTATDELGSASG